MADAEVLREKLLKALAESDELRRTGRADRILWLATRQVEYEAIVGPIDTLTVLREARDCFVGAHYVAALLLATAFIEHVLSDELMERGLTPDSGTLASAVAVAREHQIFPSDLLSRTDALRMIRNPFVHRKSPTHPHSFGSRFRERRVHPDVILEADAKEAIEVMYAYFRQTLEDA